MQNFALGAFGLGTQSMTPSRSGALVDMTIGEPRLSPFSEKIFTALSGKKNINFYYPSHGDLVLRKQIIDRYYPQCDLSEIAVTHGAIGAIDLILRRHGHSGGEILLPDPGFGPYEKLAQISGLAVKKYPILFSSSDELMDWTSIRNLVNTNTKLILINSPHNPTGRVLAQSELQKLRDLLFDFPDVKFIFDEVYRDLIYAQVSHIDLSPFIEQGYIVGSFSKVFPLQGARVGWVLTNRNLMHDLSPLLNNCYGAISSFGQEMAKQMLLEKLDFSLSYKRARLAVKNILDKNAIQYIDPQGAFFVFINVQTKDLPFVQKLAEKGISVLPGSHFGSRGAGYVRVCFAHEPEVLEAGLSALVNLIENPDAG